MSIALLNGNGATRRVDERLESRLAPILSNRLFQNRTCIYPWEFAKAKQMTVDQVIDLIREGVLLATRINSPFNKSERSNYRIPCSEYDRFVLQGGTPMHPRKNGRSRR